LKPGGDSQVKDQFELHEKEIRHKNLRSTALVSVGISLAGVPMDLFVYPDYLRGLFAIRLLAILFCLAYVHLRHDLDY